MLPVTGLVDIPYLFKRLHELPGELAMQRNVVLGRVLNLKQAQADLALAQVDALEAHKEEYFGLKNEAQRDLYRTQLYAGDTVYSCVDTVAILEASKAEADAKLQDLADELTSLRYTVRLVEAVVLGQQREDTAIYGIDRAVMAQIGERIHPCTDRACCPGPRPCDVEDPNAEADEIPF